MNKQNLKQIADFILSAPGDEELSEYLFSVAYKLKRKGFEPETMSLADAVISLMDQTKPQMKIRLESPAFKPLDDFFALTPGLHILAAPSGHGKTLWAMEWARACAESGQSVLFVSLEMTPRDLAARQVTEMINIDLENLLMGEISPTQRKIVAEIVKSYERANWMHKVQIDNLADYDWTRVFPKLWDRMIQMRPKLVVVDYAQMLHNTETQDARMSQMLGNIARDLKLYADNSEAAVLLLSQINRQGFKEIKAAKADDPFLPLSNEFIKESSGIVDAADSVQLVCMTSRINNCPFHLRGNFQVTVDKSRRLGRLGTVLLPFDFDSMKFEYKPKLEAISNERNAPVERFS